jgi:hypothetical protein
MVAQASACVCGVGPCPAAGFQASAVRGYWLLALLALALLALLLALAEGDSLK